jgi:CheY-like chemotaxis protein
MSTGDVHQGVLKDAPLTILVVDDAADMRFLARAVLESAGMRVVAEAADGQEALDRFRELQPPPIPTVILLDNQMPRLTGVEVAETILAEAPNQLIVLFSAYLSETVIAEANRLGVAACVSKTEVSKLPEIIERVAAARG